MKEIELSTNESLQSITNGFKDGPSCNIAWVLRIFQQILYDTKERIRAARTFMYYSNIVKRVGWL